MQVMLSVPIPFAFTVVGAKHFRNIYQERQHSSESVMYQNQKESSQFVTSVAISLGFRS
jgi:hypothetical protein